MGGPTYELIVSQFNACRTYADDLFKMLTGLDGYLWKLSNIATGELPDLDMSWIEYDWPQPDVGVIPFNLRPAPPTDEQTNIDDVYVPSIPTLRDIVLPDFPPVPLPDIPGWSFYEGIYVSEVLDALKARLIDLSGGGTLGIPDSVATAIFNQAKARNETGDAKIFDELSDYWAARGMPLPPMMLAAQLEDARIEIERRNTDINEKVMIQQAQMEQEGWKTILSQMIAYEGTLQTYSSQVHARALEEAKAIIQTGIDKYRTDAQVYTATMEGLKVQADIQIAENQQDLALYTAQLDKYKADLQLAVSQVEMILKAYAAKVSGYEIDIKGGAAQLDAEVKVFEGRVQQAKNQTELMLESSKAVLQAYVANRQLLIEAAKDGAAACTQLVASALSAIHASASGGYNTSESYDQTKTQPTYATEYRYNYSK